MSTEPSRGLAPAARLSQTLAWACLASALTLPLLAAVALWRLPHAEWLLRLGINTPVKVSTEQALTTFVLAMLPVLVLSFGLLKARNCLTGLARGEIFALTTVTHMRTFAGAAAVAAILGILVPSISSVLLTWQTEPGQRALTLNIASSDLLLALFAGITWQIASVWTQATELAEEHAQIV